MNARYMWVYYTARADNVNKWGEPTTLVRRMHVPSLLSLSYIPSYVHVRPGYREKSPDLQGTLKAHLRFENKISRSHRPCNENWHTHFPCVHTRYLQTHPCLKGNLRETCAHAFSLQVL